MTICVPKDGPRASRHPKWSPIPAEEPARALRMTMSASPMPNWTRRARPPRALSPLRALALFAALALTLESQSARANFPPFLQRADQTPLGTRIPLVLVHGLQLAPPAGFPTFQAVWDNFLNYYRTDPELTTAFKP